MIRGRTLNDVQIELVRHAARFVAPRALLL